MTVHKQIPCQINLKRTKHILKHHITISTFLIITDFQIELQNGLIVYIRTDSAQHGSAFTLVNSVCFYLYPTIRFILLAQTDNRFKSDIFFVCMLDSTNNLRNIFWVDTVQYITAKDTICIFPRIPKHSAAFLIHIYSPARISSLLNNSNPHWHLICPAF